MRRGDSWSLNITNVFMAVPFDDVYAKFYRANICGPIIEAGLTPIRADEMPARAEFEHIMDRIMEGIARSRFVIADVTGWNTNVIYEIGLAVGISKPILLLCHKRHFQDKDIPFDFRSYPLIGYDPYDAEDLQTRLTVKIGEMMDATPPPKGTSDD
ncbi:MAG TPA: hypothetical protein VF517_04890 [Thermoleophilaceae bacterium]|jgi:hypothetical protein